MRNLFRLRLEAPEGFQNQLLTFLDAGGDQDDTRLAVLAEWHDRALKSAFEPLLLEFARADRESRTPAGAFLEDLAQSLEGAATPLPAERLHGFELGIVLCAGRSLYVLHSPGLQPQFSLGGPPQPLQSTLRVRVKELPLPGTPDAPARIASRLRLVRVFFEDEDRAVLWLGSPARDGLPAVLSLPGEDPSGAPAGARIVLVKDPDAEPETVAPTPVDSWPRESVHPRRDRVRMSYAALVLIVVLFATALFGMSRWHRMGQGNARDDLDGMLTQGIDSSLEPPSRVSGEVVERDGTPDPNAVEVARVAPPDHSPDNQPLQLLWSKHHRDWVTSSPRWAQGRVVYGCRDGHVYAVDEGGAPVWEYDSGAGIGATPEVDGTRLFCGNYTGRAFALRALDGAELWAHDLGSRIVATPAAGRGLVFFQTYAGDVFALEQKTGRAAWKRQIGGQLRARPVVTKEHVIVVSGNGELLCLDPKSGEPRWSVALGARVLSSPLLVDDTLVIGSRDGRVLAVRLKDGQVAWQVRAGGAVDSSPAAYGEDLAIVGCGDGHVYAFAVRDGRVVWRFRTRGPILSSPSVESDHVYVTAYDKHSYVLEAETGELVGKTALGAPIYSSPLVHEGRIYFGSNDGTFYCLSSAR